MASARWGGCQPHRACLASCRAPGHPRALEEGAGGPVLPPALGLGCPGPPGANRSGPASARSPPPADHGRALLRRLARPPVPEGPHGDAVFPHEAPHATAALHAWRVGSGQPGAHGAALQPRAAPAGGLALRSLPSPWWEGDRKGPEHGEGTAVSDPRRSQPPASHGSSPSLPSGAHTPAHRPRGGSSGTTSLSSPPARSRRWPWARGAVSHWAGRVRGVHPEPWAGPRSSGRPGTGWDPGEKLPPPANPPPPQVEHQ